MEQMTTTSVLSIFNTTRAQRESFVADVVNQLETGNNDPLLVHYQIKCVEKILDLLTNTDPAKNKTCHQLAARYKKLVVEAAEKYGNKKFQFNGAEVGVGETGVKYDWGVCGDPQVDELLRQEAEVKEKLKERQEFLKALPAKGQEIREGDELITVYPPAKSSTTSVIIKLT
jgi:hypothetical protein